MIFILGGKGLVGSAFVRWCERNGRPYRVINRQEYASCIGQACDLLINANGNSRKLLATTDPIADFDANVRSVRASLSDFRFRKYVYISSCDVYPDCSSPDTTCESLTPDPAAQSPYGFHKYIGEACVRHSAADWLIFRFGGFVGPGLKKNAVYDVLRGGPLFLDPASELQFLHTDKAAEIVMRVAEMGAGREIFNLCGAGLVSLEEVMQTAGGPVTVQPGSPRVRYEIDLRKISALVDLPETRSTVLDFVRNELAGRGARV